MEKLKLNAEIREKTGKSATRNYKKQGLIPAVMYGQGKNVNLLIKDTDFQSIYPNLTRSIAIELNIAGKKSEVVLKDYDKNYMKDQFIHFDFFELNKSNPVKTYVQLNFVGNPAGVREGGTLQRLSDKVHVECLPKDLLNNLDVDVSNMRIKDIIHVRDIEFPKALKVLSKPQQVIVKIEGKKGSSTVADEEETETAEVE